MPASVKRSRRAAREQPKGSTRAAATYKICERCKERHHHFAKCKDGVQQIAGAPKFTSKDNPSRATEREDSPQPITLSATEQARADLRATIESLPEGSQQRKSLEIMLERDEARDEHQRQEKIIQAATGDPTARAPLPTILRDLSEDKGRKLNSELDQLFYREGRRPTADNLRVEAQAVKDTLGGLPAKRQAEENASRDSMKIPERIPGQQKWHCQSETCGIKFDSLTIDQVRRKAAHDPGWILACPACGTKKVLAMQEAA